ncbi:MAG: replicative DNA helicase, partial [Actinomycetota bacterium]|nr:replicative DNA helicase [Actinomycetota bacterium]
MLSATAAGEVVEAVEPEDFYRPAHRSVYEAIAELFAHGESVDPITLVDKLARTGKLDDVGGASAVHDLIAGVPTAAHAAYYAGIVQDRAVRRRLIDVAGHLARLGYEGDEDLEVLVDRAEAALYAATQRRTNSHCANIAELLSPALVELEELAAADGQFVGLPTGLAELDRLLAGLQPENLVVIAARPSVGKTALALAILEHVTVNLRRPALLFSLEMSRRELVQRLLASHARVDA